MEYKKLFFIVCIKLKEFLKAVAMIPQYGKK